MIEELKTKFGITFTNNQTTGQTAKEVYEVWLNKHCVFTNGEWELKQIDICPVKTVEERLEEAEQENKLLKAQVESNASNNEFLESCIMEMAQMVYA